jgi:hypothetical protein
MTIIQERPPTRVGDYINKFGYNPDVDASTGPDEDVVAWGGMVHWPTSVIAAANIDIVSTDAADAAAGTGARTLEIVGLDADYKLQSETVTMTGLTDVNPVNDYIRIFRAKVTTAGSNETSVGTITIDDGTNILAQILAGFGQTTQAAFTIPANYNFGWLTDYDATLVSNAASRFVEGFIQSRPFGGAWVEHDIFQSASNAARYVKIWRFPIKLEPKTDIRVRIFNASNDNLPVSSNFSVFFE